MRFLGLFILTLFLAEAARKKCRNRKKKKWCKRNCLPQAPYCSMKCMMKCQRSCGCGPVPVPGRPLMYMDEMLTAELEVANTTAWATDQFFDGVSYFDGDKDLAEYWETVALTEHASVASFSKVSMDLLANGAPPHLLTQTHQAAIDEVKHAQVALEIARGYGSRMTIGKLPVPRLETGNMGEIAKSAWVEGVLGETCAVAESYKALAKKNPSRISSYHRMVMEEELTHAALALRTAVWAYSNVEGRKVLDDVLSDVPEECDMRKQAHEILAPYVRNPSVEAEEAIEGAVWQIVRGNAKDDIVLM